ncbi:MAG: CoA transferase [Pseudomonadota bacterium]
MSGQAANKALQGLRIVELAEFVSGPYCSKLLADLGAEVIKIEKPGKGDMARTRGPFPNDVAHPEQSGLYLYLNINKLGITLDLEKEKGREIFLELVKRADILIEDVPVKLKEKMRITYEILEEINPRLIVTSIAPFGQTGPYRDYKAYYLNSYHAGHLGYLTPPESPNLDREPIKAGGFFGEYCCGLSGAVATLAALHGRSHTKKGQHVDVSKQEALIDLDRYLAAFYPNEGQNPSRLPRQSGMGSIFRCKDGYVMVNFIEGYQWQGLMELMGRPDWAEGDRFRETAYRTEHFGEIEQRVGEWMESQPKEKVYHEGQKYGCVTAAVLSTQEICCSEQAKSRGLFATIDHPVVGRLLYPTVPYRFSRTPSSVVRHAPLLGEHNEEIYCDILGYTGKQVDSLKERGII